MKLKRYTGSGIAAQEAASARASAISGGEAARHEMRKTAAIVGGLAAAGKVAENELMRVRQERQQEAELQIMLAAGYVDTAVAKIENDPQAPQKSVENPNWYKEDLDYARIQAQNELVKIKDPALRAEARKRLDVASRVRGMKMEEWSRQQARTGRLQIGAAQFERMKELGSPGGMMMAYEAMAPDLNPAELARLETDINTVVREQEIKGYTDNLAAVYAEEGVEAGDDALAGFIEQNRERLDPEVYNSVINGVNAVRKTIAVQEAEAEKEQQRENSAAVAGWKVQAAEGRLGLTFEQLLNISRTTDILTPDEAASLAIQNERAIASRTVSTKVEDKLDRHMRLGLGWTENITPTTQEAFEGLLARNTEGMEPEQAAEYMTRMIRTTGILPYSMRVALGQMAHSADAITQQNLAQLLSLDRPLDRAAMEANQINSETADIYAHAADLFYRERMPLDVVAGIVRDTRYPPQGRNTLKSEALNEYMKTPEFVELREDGFIDGIEKDRDLFDTGLFDLSGVAYDDLDPAVQYSIRSVFDAAFDRAYRRSQSASYATAVARSRVQNRFTFSNFGMQDGELRLQELPKELAGDMTSLNNSIVAALQQQLDAGRIAIRDPGGLEVYTGPDANMPIEDQQLDLEAVWTSQAGPTDPAGITITARVNGQLVSVEEMVEIDGEKVPYRGALEFFLPRGDLIRYQATRVDRNFMNGQLDGLRKELEAAKRNANKYETRRIQRGVDDDVADSLRTRYRAEMVKVEDLAARLENLEQLRETLPPDELEFEFDWGFDDEEPGGTGNVVSGESGEIAVEVTAEDIGYEMPDEEEIVSTIHQIAKEEGVPPEIAEAVSFTESSFNPNAESPVGYKGLFQLGEKFARLEGGYGNGVTAFLKPEDSIFDIHLNSRIGIQYLRGLKKRYGTWDKALQAYNYGPSRFDTALKTGAALPPETQNYAPKVGAYLKRKYKVGLEHF